MKIIKKGKHKTGDNIKIFRCVECSCIFSAEDNEYKKAWNVMQQREGITAECSCPCCGKTAFSHE